MSLPIVEIRAYAAIKPQYSREVTEFYDIHKASYDKTDFAVPLIALMKLASKKSALSGEAKKAWVLFMHEQLVEMAYENKPEKFNIALSSGPTLVDAIYCIGSRSSLFIRDSMAFYRYFSEDTEKCIDRIVEGVKSSLEKNNVIPMVEVIYWMKIYYLRNDRLADLGTRGLNKAYPDDTREKEILSELIPRVLEAFEKLSTSDIYFSKTVPRQEEWDCCRCM